MPVQLLYLNTGKYVWNLEELLKHYDSHGPFMVEINQNGIIVHIRVPHFLRELKPVFSMFFHLIRPVGMTRFIS